MLVDTRRSYRSSSSALTRAYVGGLMVYSPGALAVHTLNATMTAVLEACDGERPCEVIAADLAARYGLTAEQAAEATYLALAALLEHGLIEAT